MPSCWRLGRILSPHAAISGQTNQAWYIPGAMYGAGPTCQKTCSSNKFPLWRSITSRLEALMRWPTLAVTLASGLSKVQMYYVGKAWSERERSEKECPTRETLRPRRGGRWLTFCLAAAHTHTHHSTDLSSARRSWSFRALQLETITGARYIHTLALECSESV